MFFHQPGHRQVRHRRILPRVVQLHLGNHRHAGCPGTGQQPPEYWPGPRLGNRIINHLPLDAATAAGLKMRLTDQHQLHSGGQRRDHLLVPGRMPGPVVPGYHLRRRTGPAHTLRQRPDHTGHNFSRRFPDTAGTGRRILPRALGPAVGQVLRHGDAEQPPQLRHLPEQLLHAQAEARQHLRMAGA